MGAVLRSNNDLFGVNESRGSDGEALLHLAPGESWEQSFVVPLE
jgi:hypothetical protein